MDEGLWTRPARAAAPWIVGVVALVPACGGGAEPAGAAPASERADEEVRRDTMDLEGTLERRIARAVAEAAEDGDSIRIGLAFVDLESGREVHLGAEEPFHAASTMKVPVLLELYRQAEAHGFSVNDPVEVRNTFHSIEDGSPFTLGSDRDTELAESVGEAVAYRRLARPMITISSNLATNILLEELDPDSVQATMARIGAEGMEVLRGVQDIPAFEAGLSNRTTARAYARVLEALARCEVTSRESCEDMRTILREQEFRSDIPAGLPEGVPAGNKTGSITGIRHDGAIVEPPGREPYVLVILTEGYGDGGSASAVMTDLSRRVWEAVAEGEGAARTGSGGGVLAGDGLEYHPGDRPEGAYPRRWSSLWAASHEAWRVESLHGSRHLAHRAARSGPRALVHRGVGEVEDAEILARTMSTAHGATQNRLLLRARGGPGAETAYQFDFRPDDRVRISRYQDGSFSAIGDTEEFARGAHHWYWVRFRVEGDTLRARVWPDGRPEPEEWTLERQDDAIQGPGGVGLGSYSDSGTRYYDHIQIAVDGASAELPAPPRRVARVKLVQSDGVVAVVESGDAGAARVSGGDGGRTDVVEVPVGMARHGLRATFHGPDGRRYPQAADGRLEVRVGDPDVARFRADPDDPFAGTLEGLETGTTELELHYLEGDTEVFRSGPIPVEVSPVPDPTEAVARLSPFPRAEPEEVGMSPDGLQELERTLARWVETDEIVGGIMMVVRNGRLVMFEVDGWVDRERAIPMRADQIFQMRSMTKKMTGTSLLMLMEEGLVDPSDPVSRHLEGWDGPESRHVTVHQLLAHTAGASGPVDHGAADIVEAVQEIGRRGPAFEPGSQYSYSDPGSTTLGALVAVLTGRRAADPFMHERIFKPLGMHDTFCNQVPEGDPRIDRVAARYSGGKGSWSKYSEMAELESNDWCRASGGVYSTIFDWSRYMAALLNEGEWEGVRLLEPETLELATEPHSAEAYDPEERAERTDYYGYHFAVESDAFGADPAPRSPHFFGHGGSDGTYAFVDPEHDLMALFFTQSRRHRQSGEDSRNRFVDLVYEALEDAEVLEPGGG